MAAPDDKKILCEMCFAYVSASLEACPECGAPLGDTHPAEADEQVHGDLAKANLLRMRKDFKGAEDICLSILRRFPNNASSNVLLGDIAAERGDWSQAAEWYELALELLPDNQALRDKLAEARQTDQASAQIQSVEQIGLPTKRFPWTVVVALVSLMALAGILAAAAYNAGKERGVANSSPIILKPGDEPESTKSKMAAEQAPRPKEEAPALKQDSPSDLADRIAIASGVQAQRITQFAVDARNEAITLTLQLAGQSDDEWEGRARLVTACFQTVANAPSVLLTVTRDGNTVGTHRVERGRYADTQDQAWMDSHRDNPLAVAEHFFGKDVVSPEQPVPQPGEENPSDDAAPQNPDGATSGDPPAEGTGG